MLERMAIEYGRKAAENGLKIDDTELDTGFWQFIEEYKDQQYNDSFDSDEFENYMIDCWDTGWNSFYG